MTDKLTDKRKKIPSLTVGGGPGQEEGNRLRATVSVVAPAINATTAIVPSEMWREVPNRKYSKGGKNEV